MYTLNVCVCVCVCVCAKQERPNIIALHWHVIGATTRTASLPSDSVRCTARPLRGRRGTLSTDRYASTRLDHRVSRTLEKEMTLLSCRDGTR